MVPEQYIGVADVWRFSAFLVCQCVLIQLSLCFCVPRFCASQNTHNAVEIEFADKSAGRNQRFMDTWNFVMGALSSTGENNNNNNTKTSQEAFGATADLPQMRKKNANVHVE